MAKLSHVNIGGGVQVEQLFSNLTLIKNDLRSCLSAAGALEHVLARVPQLAHLHDGPVPLQARLCALVRGKEVEGTSPRSPLTLIIVAPCMHA